MNLPRKNALEWTVFSISLLLVLAAAGYLFVSAITQGERYPRLEVELGEPVLQPENEPDVFIMPVTVRNRGDRSAEDVQVEVTLTQGGELLETASLVFPLVPFQSERQGMVAFTRDPRQGQLAAKVLGFLTP